MYGNSTHTWILLCSLHMCTISRFCSGLERAYLLHTSGVVHAYAVRVSVTPYIRSSTLDARRIHPLNWACVVVVCKQDRKKDDRDNDESSSLLCLLRVSTPIYGILASWAGSYCRHSGRLTAKVEGVLYIYTPYLLHKTVRSGPFMRISPYGNHHRDGRSLSQCITK